MLQRNIDEDSRRFVVGHDEAAAVIVIGSFDNVVAFVLSFDGVSARQNGRILRL
jgi:hypothetical protein